MKSNADIVIIGGGIAGCSLLFGCAALDADTVLLEAGKIGSGLSSTPPRALQLPSRRHHNVDISQAQTLQTLFLQEIERLSGEKFFYKHDRKVQSDHGLIVHAYEDRLLHLQQLNYDYHAVNGVIPMLPYYVEHKNFDNHEIPLIKNSQDSYFWQLILESFTLKPELTIQALAESAKVTNGQYYEETKVTKIQKNSDGTWQITTNKGEITANKIINAAGNAACDIAYMTGHQLPLRAVKHYCFFLTGSEDFFDNHKHPPNYIGMNDDFYLYAHHPYLILNLFAKNRELMDMDTPLTHQGKKIELGAQVPCSQDDFPELKEDFDRIFAIMPELNNRISHYIPTNMLTSADGNPLIGELDDNLWVACGMTEGFSQEIFLRVGLASKVTGNNAHDTIDISDFLPNRFANDVDNEWIEENIRKNPFYTHDDGAFPDKHKTVSHPLEKNYLEANACLIAKGQTSTPAFFNKSDSAHPSAQPKDNIERINEEQINMREIGGFYDVGHHAKFEITGKDAEKFANFISAGKVPEKGEMKVAPIINEEGKPHAIFTLGHLDKNHYWLIGSSDKYQINLDYIYKLQKICKADVTITNLTHQLGGIAIAGKEAQKLFAQFSDKKIPFLGIEKLKIDTIDTIIVRFSITGEQGYEIYAPYQDMEKLYQTIQQNAVSYQMKPIGYYALNALRIEAGFPIWHEIQGVSSLYGLGMQKHIDFDKQDFWQKEHLLKQRYTRQYPLFFRTKLTQLCNIEDMALINSGDKIWVNIEEQDFCDISTLYYQRPLLNHSFAYAAHSNNVYGFNWIATKQLQAYAHNTPLLKEKPTRAIHALTHKVDMKFQSEFTMLERLGKL